MSGETKIYQISTKIIFGGLEKTKKIYIFLNNIWCYVVSMKCLLQILTFGILILISSVDSFGSCSSYNGNLLTGN